VHLDRKLDDADNYSEMVTRLAKDYIDWWMLSKVPAGPLPVSTQEEVIFVSRSQSTS